MNSVLSTSFFFQISHVTSDCYFDYKLWEESLETVEAVEVISTPAPGRIFKESKVYYSDNIHFYNASDVNTYEPNDCDDEIVQTSDRKGSEDVEHLCPSSLMSAKPTKLRNTRNETKSIANNSNYIQLIRFVRCS